MVSEKTDKAGSGAMSYLWTLVILCLAVLPYFPEDAGAETDREKGLPQEQSSISGQFLIKGGAPLSGAQVMLYDAAEGPPPSETYHRIPDVVGYTNNEGNFTIVLKPGVYYLSVVRRMSGERIGPPQQGDHVYRSRDGQGNPKSYAVAAGQRLAIGTLAEAAPLKAESTARYTTFSTAIQGLVIDADGNPVADAVVIAFTDPSVQSKPVFISDRTRKDGRYRLNLIAGTYYLRVRNFGASGPPAPGQIVGQFGDEVLAPVVVKEGEMLSNLTIKVRVFPGRRPIPGPAR